MPNKKNFLSSDTLSPDEIVVVNTKGEKSQFSVARIAKDAAHLGIARGRGFELGRELLNDIHCEGLPRISTDDIRHWLFERDPLVLRSVRRGRGICELLEFFESVPPEMNFAPIVPFLSMLSAGELSAVEAQRLIFPLGRIPLFPKEKEKKEEKKKEETEEEKQKREYIERIASEITIPGGPPPPPWDKGGYKPTQSVDELIADAEKKMLTVHYMRWGDDKSTYESTFFEHEKCDDEFKVSVYYGEWVDSCRNVNYEEIFDKARYKAVELALSICLRHGDECPVPRPTSTDCLIWSCGRPLGKIDSKEKSLLAWVSLDLKFICLCT